MKKILTAVAVALCFAGNSFAQENAGGDSASDSAFGDMDKSKVAAGTVGVVIAGAIVANNRGTAKIVPVEPPIECGPGEELVDGECVPVSTTTTVTSTTTGTTTVTATMTTPAVVTATITSLE
ncbi:MAG: hypothetical protein ACI9C4_001411 [Paraglaciecola sp.]|jgi:hypothetical protein